MSSILVSLLFLCAENSWAGVCSAIGIVMADHRRTLGGIFRVQNLGKIHLQKTNLWLGVLYDFEKKKILRFVSKKPVEALGKILVKGKFHMS